LGYVGCGEELLQQCDEQDVSFDHIVIATGSAGTHAGLAVGLRGSGSDLPILGIGVNAPQAVQEERVFKLAVETACLVEKPGCVARDDIIADCNYIGPGYGQPTAAMNEAVLLLARTEGLLFDPVYSGKALAGMIDYVREGRFDKGQRIVFLHTGGAVGLFAYADILDLT
jgi:L-cysteate sulfo-lyase